MSLLELELFLPLLFLLMAILYASVGHGGASGYLAVMALFNMSPDLMRPSALLMNVAVSSLAVYFYFRKQAFNWSLFWPLTITSIPMAYLGGSIQISDLYFKPIIGIVLLFSAYYSILSRREYEETKQPSSNSILLGTGAGLGFLSGLTGVGGGIFLSPLLLFAKWTSIKTISGIAALFILVNSIMGLCGYVASGNNIPSVSSYWFLSVLIGGIIGAKLGSDLFNNNFVRILLGFVLFISGMKMVLSFI